MKRIPVLENAIRGVRRRSSTACPVLGLAVPREQQSSTGSSSPSGVVIRLIPAIMSDIFPIERLRIESLRNNVRRKIVGTDAHPQPATPHYTNDILVDMSPETSLRLVHDIARDCPALSQACVLSKVWLRRRSIDEISPFMLSILFVYLFRRGRLNVQMGPFHMLRVLLTFLAETSLAKGAGIDILPAGAPTSLALNASDMHRLRSVFDIVVLIPRNVISGG